MSAERDRVESFGHLENGLRQAGDWYHWGPYLSERQWGTVREDYSPGGTAWEYVSHDAARSRAYRWGEDGLAGFSDVEGRLCLGLALWNGRDPILKERIFGLTGNEGNHGEDAKEYWWYLDALPSHAWNRWRYHYPQREFPYGDLVAENRRRGKLDPEYELLDTGAFDEDRYWIVEVDYAKGDPHDLLMTVRVTNAGPDTETIHVLPTAWYRNTWSWGDPDEVKPELRVGGTAAVVTEHPFLGRLELSVQGSPDVLFCDNETNAQRLFGSPSVSPTPKDGINDRVVSGADAVADAAGTKCAFWYRLEVAPGETKIVRVRLRGAHTGGSPDPWADFDAINALRLAEADQFYAELTPDAASTDEALVVRQAFAGMLWSKQLYYYSVARWLDGDPGEPPPPGSRHRGRNAHWRTFDAFDIMSMPDKWEYPWFAAWDLAFHCVALARVDPAFAKYQLLLICREWFQHPNGALAAYEWSFDDVNPPVQAWAALEVFAIDGARDTAFLSRILDKLLVNFTWWVNRVDRDGSNVFEGGFLGLDNIGPIDRSHIQEGWLLEQSDGTGWMGFYALSMAALSTILNRTDRPTTDLVLKFLEHFALISEALESQGLWDENDGFFYDRLKLPDGREEAVKVRSIVGILPLLGVAAVDEEIVARAETVNKRAAEMLNQAHPIGGPVGRRRVLLGVVGIPRVLRLFTKLFDESEFLSPYGLRAVSRYHADHPFTLSIDGTNSTIDYEPAESTTAMFGGNSNWRGPIWMPVNFLVVEALSRYARFFGDDLKVEYPTGSGHEHTLEEIAADLRERLISIFTVGEDGRRPCFGWVERLQADPEWKDNVFFNEYFHGDNGAGLGALHQTGWTGLAAELILRSRGAPVPTLGELMSGIDPVIRSVTIRLGPAACGTLDESARREWLVADGVGGYAMGTVAGLRTRRYHGLLAVAVDGPGSRMLGLAALDPVLVVGDARYRLATDEWASGAVDPAGHELLVSFALEGGLPRWRWQIGGIVLERELAMAYGAPAVGVVHRLVAADRSVRLELTPLCTWRSVHGERFANGDPGVEAVADGFVFEGAYRVAGSGFEPGGEWFRGVRAREEAARGLNANEDLWASGRFAIELAPGEAHEVTAAAMPFDGELPRAAALVSAARARAAGLVQQAGVTGEGDVQLVLAADQFAISTRGRPTAVAGYPWFGEWSRDLMTSYEGLYLSTNRSDEGCAVLRTSAATVSEGMLANTADTGSLEYNTVDGTLWFVHALGRHVAVTGDLDLGRELAPVLEEIVQHHLDGTRFGIGVDPADGLLRQGAPGWALTWMDARIDGNAVTPRAGKPVEVNALWIRTLDVASTLAGGEDATRFAALRDQARASFARRFIRPDGGGLFDVVDGAGGDDGSLRPNQLLAVSIPGVELPTEAARHAVEACRDKLLTPLGLRSLAPDDWGYRPYHRGSPAERDAAYHQGTVWPWLLGPYVDAARACGVGVEGVLAGMEGHLSEWGLGSVSETADGAAPHGATGCPFQAWSVAEVLRLRREPEAAGDRPAPPARRTRARTK